MMRGNDVMDLTTAGGVRCRVLLLKSRIDVVRGFEGIIREEFLPIVVLKFSWGRARENKVGEHAV
jgi:hypothetical protein